MKFLIADDHKIVRMGMRSWLEDEFSTQAQIDEASNATEALDFVRANKYDLIIIDVQMPDTSDFSLLQSILTIHPVQTVMLMSVLNEEVYGPRFLQAGAKCYLPKDSELSIIITAIRRVMSGKRYITEKIADALLSQQQNIAGNPFTDLTDREVEVVTMLLGGATNGQISEKLFIQPSTIASHKMKIFEKLGIQSIVELVKMAELYKFYIS